VLRQRVRGVTNAPGAVSDILLLYIRMSMPVGVGNRLLDRLIMSKDAVFTEDFIRYPM
jgi:hypothetical protein